MARQKKPAIIFIDDVDSICSARSSSADTTHRIKAEFLVQMQAVGMDNNGIYVIAATNTPWIMETSFRKKFEKRIYIPLPDETARKQIFEIEIGNTSHCLTSNDWQALAATTDGYSGADIKEVVREALMIPVREIQKATHFKKVSGPSPTDPTVYCDNLLTPCAPSDPGAMEMSWMKVPRDKLLEPKIRYGDCVKALQNIRPSVNADDLKKFAQFTADFGQ